jgi:hypothetical protein
MKNGFNFILLITLGMTMSGAASAGNNGSRKSPSPCSKVFIACGLAGKNPKKCVETFKAGGTVDGVIVTDDQLKTCKGT